MLRIRVKKPMEAQRRRPKTVEIKAGARQSQPIAQAASDPQQDQPKAVE